jgi:hypothetical protein
MSETHLPLAMMQGKLADTAADLELQALLYAIHGEDKYIEEFEKLNVTEEKNFEQIKTLIKGDEELVKACWIEVIAKAKKLHVDFKDAAFALMEAAKSKNQQAIGKKADDLETASSKFAEAIEHFAQINGKEARQVSIDTFSQKTGQTACRSNDPPGRRQAVLGFLICREGKTSWGREDSLPQDVFKVESACKAAPVGPIRFAGSARRVCRRPGAAPWGRGISNSWSLPGKKLPRELPPRPGAAR